MPKSTGGEEEADTSDSLLSTVSMEIKKFQLEGATAALNQAGGEFRPLGLNSEGGNLNILPFSHAAPRERRPSGGGGGGLGGGGGDLGAGEGGGWGGEF